ncbi:MAG TPA: hypothetical protein PKX92_08695 [Edaphocola sp.]|nr:hypothetical protein [Edaphocola sp.]
MNIYNFIYSFFYKFWEKRGNDGRIVGSAHVLGTIIIHALLIVEIIRDTTGLNLISLPNFGEYGRNKTMYFFLAVPVWIGLWFFYNRERTKRLLKEYHQKYGEAGSKNTFNILLYVVIPIILLITLAVIRQRS